MGLEREEFIGNPNRIEFTDDELDYENGGWENFEVTRNELIVDQYSDDDDDNHGMGFIGEDLADSSIDDDIIVDSQDFYGPDFLDDMEFFSPDAEYYSLTLQDINNYEGDDDESDGYILPDDAMLSDDSDDSDYMQVEEVSSGTDDGGDYDFNSFDGGSSLSNASTAEDPAPEEPTTPPPPAAKEETNVPEDSGGGGDTQTC